MIYTVHTANCTVLTLRIIVRGNRAVIINNILLFGLWVWYVW